MRNTKLLSLFAAALFAMSMWAAEMEGPWTYVGMRSGTCGQNMNNSISYNNLDNSHWGTVTFWNYDSNGIGFVVQGSSNNYTKNAVYSLYSLTKTIPSYSRCQITWQYQVKGQNVKHHSRTTLYEHTNQSTLQGLAVDFTLDLTDGSGSGSRLYSYSNKSFDGIQTSATQTRSYDFNNLTGTGNSNVARYLLMTHVSVANEAMNNLDEWGSFKSVSATETWTYRAIITFNGNGNTGGSMSNQTIDNTGTLSANAFSRTGYTFSRWTANQDGSGSTLSDKASVTASSSYKGPKTLYAQWTANKYTVTFDRQDGTGGSSSVQATYDANMPSATMPTRTGYTFQGYYDATSGGTKYYNADGTSAKNWNKASNTTLYARWEIINYTVAYNLDGGEATNPTEYTVETETFTLNNPTKEGYVFTGWTGSNGETPQTEVTIAQGSTGDKSYTANWEEIVHTYTAVGNSLAIFGNLWDESITDNDLVLQEDGTYKWVKENVTFNTSTTIEYRVCEDHAWTVKYPSTEQPAYLDIPALGDYKITIIYNPVGNEVSASAEKIGKPTIQLNGNFSGEWADTEAFEVVEEPYNSYAKLAMILEPGTYEFGVKVNGTWRANGYAYTRDSTTHVIEEGHTANLTIEADVKGYYSFYWFYERNRLSTYVPNVCGMYWKNVTDGQFEVTLGQESEVTLPKVWASNMAFVSNIASGVDVVRLVSTDETVATIEYTLSMDGLGTITLHKAGECDIYAVHDITNYYCYDSVAFHLTVHPEPGPATDIDNTAEETKATKRIANGQLLIIRDGKTYNAQGAVVR